ncbi:family 2B encapsulin nanocompartment shell protein [Allokutzneria albata]|uniref:Cyclic nucleotide-binding domain-containing protein n=1 Tax=Allokutzneria albata TaxID=211114 RepID=A0A1G9UVB5_ALLAB|nr:family 2B encapsulin nanocompartment shell protein [Allokutzneria albata]SDM63796.1 Cyclic nucleotide-binding domain-containing protein [Allokutzneria albata]
MTQTDIGATPQAQQLSLGTAAARNLATTTKSVPQMQGITPRWLLRVLPWVEAKGGAYRVNRRLTFAVGDGRLSFSNTGSEVRVVPPELCELPLLRGFDDAEVLNALADRFRQQEFAPGDTLVRAGEAAGEIFLLAHGKVNQVAPGKYGDPVVVGTMIDGDHFGDQVLTGDSSPWAYTVKAVTACTVLTLSAQEFERLVSQSESLRAQVERYVNTPKRPQNKKGEAAIDLAAGQEGEYELPGTFVDYELKPREYELSVAQTVLRVHSRVADLYNEPMNQTEQQLRLTVEALKELQEHELINNREFGLLHNADLKQRIPTHSGPPTPDDLDELLCRRRKSRYFLAHPKTIAAFGRECNKRGLYPEGTVVDGRQVMAWRGVPMLPCDKIPITDTRTSSIIVMRTGEDDQGVIGLRQTGLPDEYEPGVSVRFTGVNEKAIISYLVSAYYSAAVLVPDALGVLENVEIGH